MLLLLAGAIKGTTWLSGLPVDLTLAGALLATAVAGASIDRRTWRHTPVLVVVPALWAMLSIGFFGYESSASSEVKVQRLFVLTFLCAVLPALLLRDVRAQRWFCLLLVAGGLLAAGSTLASPDPAVAQAQRLAAEGSTTIGVGRAIGAAVVTLAIVGASGHLRLGALVLLPILTWVLIGTGTRGTLISAVVAVVAVAGLKRGYGSQRFRRIVLVGVALAGPSSYALLGDTFAFRRATGMEGFEDASTSVRLRLVSASLELIRHHPFGVGWGGLTRSLPPGVQVPVDAEYTHNIVLEVTLEAGWLAGLALVVYTIWSIVRLVRRSADPQVAVFLGLALFYVANAQVSCDINGNRAVFIVLSLAWMGRSRAGGGSMADPEPVPARSASA